MNRTANAFDEHRSIAERSPIPIALTRAQTHQVAYANSAFCELFGESANVIEGQSLTRSFIDGAKLEPVLNRVYTNVTIDVALDIAFEPAPGRVSRAAVMIYPITDDRTTDRCLVATVLVGEAQRTADEMKALLENMTEGVAVFDAAGQVVLVNPVGRATFGFGDKNPTAEDYRGSDLRRLDGTRLDFEQDVLSRILRDEPFTEEEILVLGKDGVRRRLLVSGRAVRDEQGKMIFAIKVYRDITQLRELEQLREQYVCLISHDLRGPLSGARMATELLYRELLTLEQRKRIAAQIIKKLDRMDRMVRDLLDAQRIRAGQFLPLRIDECDLVMIAREVIEELATVHGDQFVLRAPRNVVGHWSAEELRRAIWNLASNAIKYGSPHTIVQILIDTIADRIVLAVHNDGPPIPIEDQPNLFTAFSRTKAATEGEAGGWGLGLTLVRGCAEAHGGMVEVRSDAELGTTFTVTLPLDARAHQHSHPPRPLLG